MSPFQTDAANCEVHRRQPEHHRSVLVQSLVHFGLPRRYANNTNTAGCAWDTMGCYLPASQARAALERTNIQGHPAHKQVTTVLLKPAQAKWNVTLHDLHL